MKVTPQCIPCILNVRLGEILKSNLPKDKKLKAEKVLIKSYEKWITKDISTVKLATLAFRKVKKLIKEEDPYLEFKLKSYEVSEKLVKELRSRIEEKEGYEKFRAIVLASVFANFLDPGAPLGVGPEEVIEKISNGRIAKDEISSLYEYLSKIKSVTFVLDNAGEALVDLVLIEELWKMGLSIKIIAKGKPYQNDVTYSEAKKLGFEEYGELISTRNDSVGLISGLVSKSVLKKMNETDLIIAKGMANFESFCYESPEKPTFSLLVAKCEPVANAAGIKQGEAAAFFFIKPKS